MQFFDRSELEYSEADARANQALTEAGDLLNSFSAPAREIARLEREAYVLNARSPGPVLNAQAIADLSKIMLDLQQLDVRRAYFRSTPIERTFQGQVIPLIEKVLGADPSVRRVVNIGAHYGHCDWELAKRFENVEFLSVDFAANLAEFNAEFSRPNLTFRPGYAMAMLDDGQLDADLYFMSSTAVTIRSVELSKYYAEFKKRGRYVVVNEPIYQLPGGGILDPSTIPADASVATFQYTDFEGDGGPLCFTHNYRALLTAAGFDVPYYRAFKPAFTDLRLVHIIARA